MKVKSNEKENIDLNHQLIIGREDKKKGRKAKIMEYLKAINTKDLEFGAKDYCQLYNIPFTLDNFQSNCHRLQLLKLLDAAIIGRFEDLKDILNCLMSQYRFLMHFCKRPVSSSETTDQRLNEYFHYFRQWFKHIVRCMYSFSILQEGQSAYPLQKEELNYRCEIKKRVYFSLRSTHAVDSIYRQSVDFFERNKMGKVMEAIDSIHLPIDNVSLQILAKQQEVAGFMVSQVKTDLQKIGFEIATFSVTEPDLHWRFSSKTCPMIRLKAYRFDETIAYDAQTPLSDNAYSDSKSFTALQSISDVFEASLLNSRAGLFTDLPELPASTPVQAKDSTQVRTSVSDRKARHSENEKAFEELLNESVSPFKAAEEDDARQSTTNPPAASNDATFTVHHMPLESGSSQQQLKKESAVATQEEKDLWADYDDQQEISSVMEQKLLFEKQPDYSDDEELWDEKSSQQQQIITVPKRSARLKERFIAADEETTKIDPQRVEELMNHVPMFIFKMDQSLQECYDITKGVVKTSIVKMADEEDKATTVMKHFLRRALREKLLQGETQRNVRVRLTRMFLDLYDDSRKDLIAFYKEKVKELPKAQYDLLFIKQEGSLSPWQRIIDKKSAQLNRLYCNVACTFWDEICNEYYSANPLFLDKLLEMDRIPRSEPAWNEFKKDVKGSDFFEQFDVMQFVSQLKKIDPMSNAAGENRMLVKLLNVGVEEENYTMERMIANAKKMITAQDPSYKGALSKTAHARKKRKSIDPIPKSIDHPCKSKKTIHSEKAPVEVGIMFEEAMDAFGNCFSNTYEQLGIELAMVKDWQHHRWGKKFNICAVIIGLLKEIFAASSLKEIGGDDPSLTDKFRQAFKDALPLVMILRNDSSLYDTTPANGRCYYLLHYQLHCRALNNYPFPMEATDELSNYLNNRKVYINALEYEVKNLSEAVKQEGVVEDLKVKMRSVVNTLPKVLEFEHNNDEAPSTFMSNKDWWGKVEDSGILFFAPQLTLSMAMFHDLDHYCQTRGCYLVDAEKMKTLGDKSTIFVTSTAMASNGFLYCASMDVLSASLTGLNFGLYDGSHFFPMALQNETEESLLIKLRAAYDSFCVEALKIFSKLDMTELQDNLDSKMQEYVNSRKNKKEIVGTHETMVLFSPPGTVERGNLVRDAITNLLLVEDLTAEEKEEGAMKERKVPLIEAQRQVNDEVEEEEEEVVEGREGVSVADYIVALEEEIQNLLSKPEKPTVQEWERTGRDVLVALKRIISLI